LASILRDEKPTRKEEYIALLLHAMMLEENFQLKNPLKKPLGNNCGGFRFKYTLHGQDVLLHLLKGSPWQVIGMTSNQSVKLEINLNNIVSEDVDNANMSKRYLLSDPSEQKLFRECLKLFKERLIFTATSIVKSVADIAVGKESIECLPNECLFMIIKEINNRKQLSKLSEVSKRFNDIIENNVNKRMIWKNLIRKDFPQEYDKMCEEQDGQKVKEAYKKLYKEKQERKRFLTYNPYRVPDFASRRPPLYPLNPFRPDPFNPLEPGPLHPVPFRPRGPGNGPDPFNPFGTDPFGLGPRTPDPFQPRRYDMETDAQSELHLHNPTG